ncbi:MAG: DUF1674 domain-containing protein [Alphaproteobacteria bacterium]|nr:DUF1674 domain-containing protein [Alphaproteobacteria bacterium]
MQVNDKDKNAGDAPKAEKTKEKPADNEKKIPEIGGRGGLEPTRFKDWEVNGRCVDF